MIKLNKRLFKRFKLLCELSGGSPERTINYFMGTFFVKGMSAQQIFKKTLSEEPELYKKSIAAYNKRKKRD